MKLRCALFLLSFFFLSEKKLCAQQYSFSLPEKLQFGVNNYEVLGNSSEGVVVLSSGKTIHSISVYSSTMKLQWKKSLNLKEFGFVNVQKIFLLGDSALIFYTVQSRGETLLKVAKVNQKFEVLRAAIILDTLSTTTLVQTPSVSFVSSFGKKRFVAYYDDLNTVDRRKMHCISVSDFPAVIWKNEFRPNEFSEPESITVLPDDSLLTWVVFGENQIKNFRNDFLFNKLMLLCYNDSSGGITNSVAEESGMIFTSAIVRHDRVNRQIILASLYADSPGNESNGIFLNRFNYNASLVSKKLAKFSTEYLSDLSGNNPPKRSDGFYSFSPGDMIVKRDGGIVFLSESHNVSTESFNNPGFGNYGVTSSLTVNYYHYDEVLALSLDASDSIQWSKVLHKKQQTEGDGGFFSSYYLTIAPAELILVFNDFSSGMAVLSTFTLNSEGAVERTEIFNADKKGMLPVPQSGKQISPNEVVLPSLKKGYLQYIKIIF